MYKIYQNYLQPQEYEYAHDYKTLAEAQNEVQNYQDDDQKNNQYHNYTIVSLDDFKEYDSINVGKVSARELSIASGLSLDEAENIINDLTI
jgi:hypothetical protein